VGVRVFDRHGAFAVRATTVTLQKQEELEKNITGFVDSFIAKDLQDLLNSGQNELVISKLGALGRVIAAGNVSDGDRSRLQQTLLGVFQQTSRYLVHDLTLLWFPASELSQMLSNTPRHWPS
jgi:hypothetical protein